METSKRITVMREGIQQGIIPLRLEDARQVPAENPSGAAFVKCKHLVEKLEAFQRDALQFLENLAVFCVIAKANVC